MRLLALLALVLGGIGKGQQVAPVLEDADELLKLAWDKEDTKSAGRVLTEFEMQGGGAWQLLPAIKAQSSERRYFVIVGSFMVALEQNKEKMEDFLVRLFLALINDGSNILSDLLAAAIRSGQGQPQALGIVFDTLVRSNGCQIAQSTIDSAYNKSREIGKIIGFLDDLVGSNENLKNCVPCLDEAPDGEQSCIERKLFGQCTTDWLIQGNFCAKACGLCTERESQPQESVSASQEQLSQPPAPMATVPPSQKQVSQEATQPPQMETQTSSPSSPPSQQQVPQQVSQPPHTEPQTSSSSSAPFEQQVSQQPAQPPQMEPQTQESPLPMSVSDSQEQISQELIQPPQMEAQMPPPSSPPSEQSQQESRQPSNSRPQPLQQETQTPQQQPSPPFEEQPPQQQFEVPKQEVVDSSPFQPQIQEPIPPPQNELQAPQLEPIYLEFREAPKLEPTPPQQQVQNVPVPSLQASLPEQADVVNSSPLTIVPIQEEIQGESVLASRRESPMTQPSIQPPRQMTQSPSPVEIFPTIIPLEEISAKVQEPSEISIPPSGEIALSTILPPTPPASDNDLLTSFNTDDVNLNPAFERTSSTPEESIPILSIETQPVVESEAMPAILPALPSVVPTVILPRLPQRQVELPMVEDDQQAQIDAIRSLVMASRSEDENPLPSEETRTSSVNKPSLIARDAVAPLQEVTMQSPNLVTRQVLPSINTQIGTLSSVLTNNGEREPASEVGADDAVVVSPRRLTPRRQQEAIEPILPSSEVDLLKPAVEEATMEVQPSVGRHADPQDVEINILPPIPESSLQLTADEKNEAETLALAVASGTLGIVVSLLTAFGEGGRSVSIAEGLAIAVEQDFGEDVSEALGQVFSDEFAFEFFLEPASLSLTRGGPRVADVITQGMVLAADQGEQASVIPLLNAVLQEGGDVGQFMAGGVLRLSGQNCRTMKEVIEEALEIAQSQDMTIAVSYLTTLSDIQRVVQTRQVPTTTLETEPEPEVIITVKAASIALELLSQQPISPNPFSSSTQMNDGTEIVVVNSTQSSRLSAKPSLPLSSIQSISSLDQELSYTQVASNFGQPSRTGSKPPQYQSDMQLDQSLSYSQAISNTTQDLRMTMKPLKAQSSIYQLSQSEAVQIAAAIFVEAILQYEDARDAQNIVAAFQASLDEGEEEELLALIVAVYAQVEDKDLLGRALGGVAVEGTKEIMAIVAKGLNQVVGIQGCEGQASSLASLAHIASLNGIEEEWEAILLNEGETLSACLTVGIDECEKSAQQDCCVSDPLEECHFCEFDIGCRYEKHPGSIENIGIVIYKDRFFMQMCRC